MKGVLVFEAVGGQLSPAHVVQPVKFTPGMLRNTNILAFKQILSQTNIDFSYPQEFQNESSKFIH